MDYALHVKNDITEHQMNHPSNPDSEPDSPQPDGEPVAWGWKKENKLHVTNDKRFKHFLFKCGYELIPLYPGKPIKKNPKPC